MNTLPATTSHALIQERGDDLEVSAMTPDEMKNANAALIAWCDKKIAAVKSEAAELLAAFKHAVERKWKSATLKHHADLATNRATFFEKIKAALEQGFYVVPNFPVTCFAIRTGKGKPRKMATFNKWSNLQQNTEMLPAGEGEYQNPFPEIWQQSVPSDKDPNRKEYWAEKWDEFEFPVQMAKPHIMRATTRAMALKVFDDFGVLPGRVKADPIVVGRIKDPRSGHHLSQQRLVSFIIAWHLDTRTL